MGRQRGFTLIEMVTVIAVLGALMALVLPPVVSARSFARQAPCMSHLHQIGLAFSMYLADYDRRPVDLTDLAAAGYVTPEILVCPADPTGDQGGLVCRENGGERQECWDSSVRFPTSYIYLSGRRTDHLWSQLEMLASRGSYLVCQCHGQRRGEWGDRYTQIPWYEGKVLRLSFDGSVHVGRTHWARGRNWQEMFNIWKVFTDEPPPPESDHPPG